MTGTSSDATEPLNDNATAGAAIENPLDLLLEDDDEGGSALIGRLCVGLIAVILAGAVWQSYQLGLGSLGAPGPGLWPFGVAVVTFVLSIVLLILGVTWSGTAAGGNRWAIAAIAAFLVYCAILPVLGFVLASIPVALFFTRVVGNAGWIASIATGVLAPVGAYYIFSELLAVPLVGPSFL
ncbi:tripartite tricarboxylate transporter TctB family protein [Pseudactinotalea sp. Z1748]|uniref:tripartite tricarboxylate transporter TctB family protein n=1 Tax=Pseudactinotalea sp. Z1748 TaxID=3413027 RepID=UPI003C7B04B7